jgi:citrate lyase beta subunit
VASPNRTGSGFSPYLPEKTRLWVMIETPRAILSIAAAGGRLAGLTLGTHDLATAEKAYTKSL